jgi:uncharacterized membrane protein YczE
LILHNRLINYVKRKWKVKAWNTFDSLFVYAIVISFLINFLTMIFPSLENYYMNAINLFSIGLVLVFAGLGESAESTLGKRIFLLLGSVWVVYLCLYYFTGFHNPAWGN